MIYKIIGTEEELSEIGADIRIMGCDATFIKDYNDGYYHVDVTYNIGTEDNKFMVTNGFDIPLILLKEKENG